MGLGGAIVGLGKGVAGGIWGAGSSIVNAAISNSQVASHARDILSGGWSGAVRGAQTPPKTTPDSGEPGPEFGADPADMGGVARRRRGGSGMGGGGVIAVLRSIEGVLISHTMLLQKMNKNLESTEAATRASKLQDKENHMDAQRQEDARNDALVSAIKSIHLTGGGEGGPSAMSALITGVAGIIGDVIKTIGQVIGDSIKAAADLAGKALIAAAEIIGHALEGIGAAIGGLLGGGKGMLGGMLGSAMSGIVNGFKFLLPFLPELAGVAGAAILGYQLYNAFQQSKDWDKKTSEMYSSKNTDDEWAKSWNNMSPGAREIALKQQPELYGKFKGMNHVETMGETLQKNRASKVLDNAAETTEGGAGGGMSFLSAVGGTTIRHGDSVVGGDTFNIFNPPGHHLDVASILARLHQ